MESKRKQSKDGMYGIKNPKIGCMESKFKSS
jgi:hypothetical protein